MGKKVEITQLYNKKETTMKMLTAIASILMISFIANAEPAHDYSDILSGLRLNNACTTASTVQSINPVQVCTQLVPITHNPGTDHEYTDWVCKAYEMRAIVNPRSIVRTVCVKWKPGQGDIDPTPTCVEYAQQAVTLPQTIKTVDYVNHGEISEPVYSTHTFPACR